MSNWLSHVERLLTIDDNLYPQMQAWKSGASQFQKRIRGYLGNVEQAGNKATQEAKGYGLDSELQPLIRARLESIKAFLRAGNKGKKPANEYFLQRAESTAALREEIARLQSVGMKGHWWGLGAGAEQSLERNRKLEKAKPGPKAIYDELVKHDAEMRRNNKSVSDKDVLATFKKLNPLDPIFQKSQPAQEKALRAARSKRRKKGAAKRRQAQPLAMDNGSA